MSDRRSLRRWTWTPEVDVQTVWNQQTERQSSVSPDECSCTGLRFLSVLLCTVNLILNLTANCQTFVRSWFSHDIFPGKSCSSLFKKSISFGVKKLQLDFRIPQKFHDASFWNRASSENKQLFCDRFIHGLYNKADSPFELCIKQTFYRATIPNICFEV